MNCCHNINYLFNEEFTCLESHMWNPQGMFFNSEFAKAEIARLIDHMGLRSAESQNLQIPMTSYENFENSSQRIYILKLKNIYKYKGAVVAFARVGWRGLYLEDDEGFVAKTDVFCLMDMYVAQAYQRQGYGKRLLEFICTHEYVKPWQIVIDQPTDAIMSFFSKHYFLFDFLSQDTGKYLVWKRYFQDMRPTRKSGFRYEPLPHTHTSNPRDYLGGPWPPVHKGDTVKYHRPPMNYHRPAFAVPGYTNDCHVTDNDLRLDGIAQKRHENYDYARNRLVASLEQTPEVRRNYGPTAKRADPPPAKSTFDLFKKPPANRFA